MSTVYIYASTPTLYKMYPKGTPVLSTQSPIMIIWRNIEKTWISSWLRFDMIWANIFLIALWLEAKQKVAE